MFAGKGNRETKFGQPLYGSSIGSSHFFNKTDFEEYVLKTRRLLNLYQSKINEKIIANLCCDYDKHGNSQATNTVLMATICKL